MKYIETQLNKTENRTALSEYKNYFCGWYFKCQSQSQTLALIPAIHISQGKCSCSIQLISNTEIWNVPIHSCHVKMRKDFPYAILGDNIFSGKEIHLNLKTDNLSASGHIQFGIPSRIRYDIMGPFRYVPFMECRHSIFSMRHNVNGKLCINGTDYNFENAVGYIEGDRGYSFPKHYAWTQCCFQNGSLMLSVAEVPLGPVQFTGVIGIIQINGKEYRIASYLGARVIKNQNGYITVRQGSMTFTAVLMEKTVLPLSAPVEGSMSRTIRENAACRARYNFSCGNHTILNFETRKASFEYEY